MPPVVWGGNKYLLCPSCLCILSIDGNTQTIKEVIQHGEGNPNIRKAVELFDLREKGTPILSGEKTGQATQGEMGEGKTNTPREGLLQEPQYKDSSDGGSNKSTESKAQYWGKKYQLERRQEGNRGLCLHSCPTGTPSEGTTEREEAIYSRTQVRNGAASWTVFRGLGEGAPQKQHEERQQNREFGISERENTSWKSFVSALPSMVFGTLKCPVCHKTEFKQVDCQHEWGKVPPPRRREINDIVNMESKQATSAGTIYEMRESDFCSLCGAWRGQLGLEPTFQLYIEHLMMVFLEAKRVLRKDGTLWVVMGDSYASGKGTCYNPGGGVNSLEKKKKEEYSVYPLDRGNKSVLEEMGVQPKCLYQIPSRFTIAMTDAGWILRNEIIWWKRNAMPSSVRDRFTVDFEKVFFFTRSGKYWFEQQKEPTTTFDYSDRDRDATKLNNCPGRTRMSGLKTNQYIERNMRTVWDIPTKPFAGAHFAVFPEALVERCIAAGCPPDGIVCDPFAGSGTTMKVALRMGRRFIGFELNPDYIKIADGRIELERQQLRLAL